MPEFRPGTEVESVSAAGLRALKHRERRRQARLEVDASATIFLVRVGSTLRGRIADLSLSGCRIQTEEQFQVGIYTRVEAEFYLQRLPFRLAGVIQVVHDSRTIGIWFLDLSDRKREQVADLIAEIKKIQAAEVSPEAAQGPEPV